MIPYDATIEKNVPPKEGIIRDMIELSKLIGKERVVWRYDPILMTDVYDLATHVQCFAEYAQQLEGIVNKCVISLFDAYAKSNRNMKGIRRIEYTENEWRGLLKKMSSIASRHNIIMETCSEKIDLSNIGILHGRCIDDRIISKICHKELQYIKDPNQRQACGCVKSIDIGAYNCCRHNCVYCYANTSEGSMRNNILKHDPLSPVLNGQLEEQDIIRDRSN